MRHGQTILKPRARPEPEGWVEEEAEMAEEKAADEEGGVISDDEEPTTERDVSRIHNHRAYGGTWAGVWFNIIYTDGTQTGRGAYERSLPLESQAGRRALTKYLTTSRGKKIAKYVPESFISV